MYFGEVTSADRCVVREVDSPSHIGSYRIERLLGVGSFATVWLGFDPTLGAHVAIKVLAENWSHDLRVRERFLDEGRMLWQIDHERLVRVHSVGELPDGRPYLVMAWARGGSLRDRLTAGPMHVRTSISLLREIAAGAAVLHDHGVVHRDLTPGNVLFRTPPGDPETEEFATGQVLISDLGLAKALAAASGLTARAGTPGYMAPEQDDPLAVVDVRADVFGLGRLGSALLCVPSPGRSGSPAMLRDGVPAGVADVLRKATAYKPADRYRDAAGFSVALARATASSGRAGGRVRAMGRRRIRIASLLTALASAVVVTTVAADSAPSRSSGPRTGTDVTGRITVTLPEGWRVAGSGWEGQRDPGGDLEPALVMSPDPARWLSDPSVPGAFVGLSTVIATRTTPAQFVAEHPHARCVAQPLRLIIRAGIDWIVAEYGSCPNGKPVVVEIAGVAKDGAGLVYVQIAPPAGSDASFVDGLLAGIHVRG
jgi:hypothetical protein